MAKTMDPPSRYMAEYSLLTERLVNGKEAVDMMAEFWEKLAYIEYNYAKSIAQLCNSRHGKLQKMFNDKTTEYFRPLQSVWGAVLEDLSSYSESHLNVAYTLQREVKPALTNFSQDELSKQIEVAMHGKKVMVGLKEDLSKLAGERKKVYKAILSDSAEEMKEIKDDVIDNQNKTKQGQKLWIRSRDSHAHAYNVTMPSILEELNNTSARRVDAVCNSVGQFTSLITSTATTFATASSTLLAAQSAADTVRYAMESPSPEPPGELQLNMSRTEMMEYCQTPAKKFLNNIQEKVFPTNVGNIFVNTMRTAGGGDGSPDTDLSSPLKDISQKVATMWSNIRTRTLSGNLIETATEDTGSTDEVLLDPDDVDILDPGTVKGTVALDDEESVVDKPEEEEARSQQELVEVETEPSRREVEVAKEEDLVSIVDQQQPAEEGEGRKVEEGVNERDMIISLSNEPDGTEEYVVVNE